MRYSFKLPFFLIASMFFLISAICQPKQILMPAASLPASVKQTIGFTEVLVEYSRPALKGRDMYKELTPIDKVWRTGANQSTIITFSDEVVINNTIIPKGTYSIWTIPGIGEWTIILNKETVWGTQYEKIQASDIMRFQVPAVKVNQKTESFEISFINITDSTGMLRLEWEFTQVDFLIKDDLHKKLRKLIDIRITELDKQTYQSQKDSAYAGVNYWQAAVYCEFYKYEMEKAIIWCDKAMKILPTTSFQPAIVKAKLLLHLNRKAEAIEAAQVAVDLASVSSVAKQRGFDKQAEEFLKKVKG